MATSAADLREVRLPRCCAAVVALTCVVTVGLTGRASADAPDLTATGTSVAGAAPGVSTPLTGIAVSGDDTDTLYVQVATDVGTISIDAASPQGSLAYGYSSWTDQSSIAFTATEEEADADLATVSLDPGSTAGQTAHITVTAAPYDATVVFSSSNDHFYQYVPGQVTWAQAAYDASQMTYGGQTGYLATMPTSAVNDIVTSYIPGAINVWFGAYATDCDTGAADNTCDGVARTWRWYAGPLAGETFTTCTALSGADNCSAADDTYTNWSGGQPDDQTNSGSYCTDPLDQDPLQPGGVGCGDPVPGGGSCSAGDDPGGEHFAVTNWTSANGLWNDLENDSQAWGCTDGYLVEYGSAAYGNTDGAPFTDGVASVTSDVAIGEVPDAPTGVTATLSGTTATVSWTAPADDGGWSVTSYTATASTGQSCTATAPATSCEISGLPGGTAVTFAVTAANGVGTSEVSASSSPVTTPTPPAPPASAGGTVTAPAATVVSPTATDLPAALQQLVAAAAASGSDAPVFEYSPLTPPTIDIAGVTGVTGPVTYTVTPVGSSTVTAQGSLTASATPGSYSFTPTGLAPGGYQVTIVLTTGSTTVTRTVFVYIDPEGTLVDEQGLPVAGATATLYYHAATGTDASGDSVCTGLTDADMTVVPAGSALLSPATRTNPETTGADGGFSWLTASGCFQIRSATTVGGVAYTGESAILSVPPAQLGIQVVFTGLNPRPAIHARTAAVVVLPRSGAARSRLSVTLNGYTPRSAVTGTATLYGPTAAGGAVGHPVGTVSFAVKDGTTTVPAIRVTAPGHYRWEVRIPATSAEPAESLTGSAAPRFLARRPVYGPVVIDTGFDGRILPRAQRSARPAEERRQGAAGTLSIPSLGIEAPLGRAGVAAGSMAIPADVHRVGWLDESARTTDLIGMTVIAGHVSDDSDSPGALWNLRKAVRGTIVRVVDRSGAVHRYRVTGRLYRDRTGTLPASLFRTTGAHELALVTCASKVVYPDGRFHYTQNLVVFATPIG